ncbi:hypothetical protein TL16_g01681 [Triparma laevis f. inornata]|uniref:Cation efflux protein transmembrane domain-containing protein n=1 Tax=Triparma laevis f. inornata TaxID=1714386 RepID=A0A9W6ZM10_9STRA|nr:hypothetical protein TL16_g01681 [Triparma laevis f. inornata]
MLRANRLLPRFKSSALKYLSIKSSQLTIQHSSPLSPKSGYPLFQPNHLLLLPPPTRSFSSKSPSDKNTSDPSPPSANTKWGLSTSNIPLDDRLQATLNSVLSTKHSTRTTSTVRLALLGNLIITGSKFAAYSVSGSSAMLSESIHSLVDSGNQALLLIGLRDVGRLNDASHPYGYGKSIYFWSLVSALGTFWLGAGVSMTHSVQYLMNPGLEEVTWHVWGVLGVSLVVDGWVLRKVVGQVMEDKPKEVGYFKHIMAIRDPATLAILLEDGAACTGVLIAGLGISLSHLTSNPIFDGLAGVGVSCLLAGMGFTLARLNQRFLLGQAVDSDIVQSINAIILERDSIDSVASVQSQWTGPYSFSYKAEIDVDGTFLAAKLMDR